MARLEKAEENPTRYLTTMSCPEIIPSLPYMSTSCRNLLPSRDRPARSIQRSGASSPVTTDSRQEMAVRVGERRKRAKKVFDPSENNVPSKRKRGRPMGSVNKNVTKKQSLPTATRKSLSNKSKSDNNMDSSNEEKTNDSYAFVMESNSNKNTGGVCTVCRQHRTSEKLISCRDCSSKAHPSCLKGKGILKLRLDYTWQCPHCKTCVICIETNDAGLLTVCTLCTDAYHALCHVPPIPESMRGSTQWECKNCQDTKIAGSSIESAYLDKTPGSDRSSKLSDHSDSANQTLDRRRSSVTKNSESDDKNETKNSFNSSHNDTNNTFVPIEKTKSRWDYSRKLVSPDRENVYNWKRADDAEDEDRELNNIQHKKFRQKNKTEVAKNNKEMILYSSDDINKGTGDELYQKHPYFKDDDSIDSSIPDAASWTSNDVHEYFLMYFPEQAHIFKDQDIDGKSLLLMRRSDVVNSLGLPLGPALKIYRHIVKLQSRRDDITMCWF